MFESLSDKLHDVFKKICGQGTLTEANIVDAMREIRLALLDADVNLEVVNKFINSVKTACLGQDVIRSVTPSQQVVKIVHDHLVELLGGGVVELELDNKPAVIMLVGLHGSGKTTTAGKLANRLKKQGKSVLLVAGDVYRPAAIDQLQFIGNEIGVSVYTEPGNKDVVGIATNAVKLAKLNQTEVVIIDTAGRLQIDEDMVQELILVRNAVHPNEVLLVADAALGQEAVSVAQHFHQAINLTGFIVTKLDGDARGGAVLSIRDVTGCPVKFVGTGEKLDNLELFYPDRMAGRILGMGDIVTLVENATAEMSEYDGQEFIERATSNKLNFNDMLNHMRYISKLGGFEGFMKYLPGGRNLVDSIKGADPRRLKRAEAIILSMTPEERTKPQIIDFSRRKRIAKGSGTNLEMVGSLISQFYQLRKMLGPKGKFGKFIANGLPEGDDEDVFRNQIMGNVPAPISKKEHDKKKRLAKLAKKQRQKQRKRK